MTSKYAWEALQRVVDRGETRDRIEVAIIVALQDLKAQVKKLQDRMGDTDHRRLGG